MSPVRAVMSAARASCRCRTQGACEAAGSNASSTISQRQHRLRQRQNRPAVRTLLTDCCASGSAWQEHVLIRTPTTWPSDRQNPFSDAAVDRPNLLMVHFLDGPAQPGAGERLAASAGRNGCGWTGHLYIAMSESVGRSKLTRPSSTRR